MFKNNLSQTQKLKIAQWMIENHNRFIADKMSCPMVAAAAEKHFSDYKMVVTPSNVRGLAKSLEWTDWPNRDKTTYSTRVVQEELDDKLGVLHDALKAVCVVLLTEFSGDYKGIDSQYVLQQLKEDL